MRLSVTRLTEFPSACRHQAGLGRLASHYSELFGTEGDFNTALDLADIELAADGSYGSCHAPLEWPAAQATSASIASSVCRSAASPRAPPRHDRLPLPLLAGIDVRVGCAQGDRRAGLVRGRPMVHSALRGRS